MASKMVVPDTAFSLQPRRAKLERIKAPQHLAWIRTLPCLATGYEPNPFSEAAHVSYPDPRYGKCGRGFGTKEEDCFVIPLSIGAHRNQHRQNERTFWEALRIDPVRVAMALWNWSGNDEIARVIIAANREDAL